MLSLKTNMPKKTLPKKTQLLVVALDAVDVDLMQRWIGEGHLPHLEACEHKSRFQRTRSQPGVFAGSVWPSIGSGLGAGHAGRYYSTQTEPGGYGNRRFLPRDLPVKPFWDELSAAGKRVAVLNVPKFPASEDLNGVHLTGWSTSHFDGPVDSYPRDFASDVTKRYGGHPRQTVGHLIRQRDGARKAIRLLESNLERQRALAVDLLNQGGWDLFLTTFSECHCAGHFLWHLHDPENPNYDAALVAQLGNAVLHIYRLIDDAIGSLLENVGPEVPVLILSSHGMRPLASANHLLDDILRRLEGEEKRTDTSMREFVQNIGRRMPDFLKESLRSFGEPLVESEISKDRSRRKCFAVKSNTSGGCVGINLAGRQPNGRVKPGAEYDEFVDTLIADLKQVENVETGEKIVSGIWRTRDVFSGPFLAHLPDIIMEWQGSGPISRVRSNKIGEVERHLRGWEKWGDHTPHGFMMYSAPGLTPHRVNETASVLDLAPTIAALFGVNLRQVDGRAWPLDTRPLAGS